ncbi:hypothetical protein [Marivirga aurantiaca]|uniref:hypothetical protein n=1 Tax=Marivirga aurantiaca TaxID=2802615 RepID=UPI001F2BD5A6|nr:hypothetical protein [Marivirga aurantiaca]
MKKLNLIELFPNVSTERLPKIKNAFHGKLSQLFPDISGEIRSRTEFKQKIYKERALQSSDLIDNKNLKWILVIFTLSITLYVCFNTFSLSI